MLSPLFLAIFTVVEMPEQMDQSNTFSVSSPTAYRSMVSALARFYFQIV